MSSEAEARDFLHTSTYFVNDTTLQDVRALKRMGDYTSINQPIYTRVVEHIVSDIGGSTGPQSLVIETRLGYAIANIRLHGDNWSDAALVVGRVDCDWIKIPQHGNSFFLTDEGRCLPFVSHHKFEVRAKASAGDSLRRIEYDIVEFPAISTSSFQFPAKSTVYSGDYTVSAGVKNVKLLLTNPVEMIRIDVLKGRVESMEFVVETKESTIVTLPVQKLSDNQFVLEFGEKTVNFSRVDDSYLRCNVSEEATICPRATTLNVLRSVAGMYGMAYAM